MCCRPIVQAFEGQRIVSVMKDQPHPTPTKPIICVCVCINFIMFLWCCELNPRPCAWRASILSLSCIPQSKD